MRISDWSSDVCSSDLRVDKPGASGQPSLDAERKNAGGLAAHVFLGKRMFGMVGQAGVLHPRYLIVPLQEFCYPQCVFGMAFHAQRQCFYALEHQKGIRSDEHTSELQSLMRISYAVFCLKKKKKTKKKNMSKL